MIFLVFKGTSLIADDQVIQAETFLKTFSVPKKDLNRLIRVEGPRKVTLVIHFKTNSSEIEGEHSISQLEQLGLALKNPTLAKRAFSVEGHSDVRGDAGYNMKLSQERSASVVQHLVEKFGVDSRQLTPNGQGEFFPVDPGDTDEAHAKNRRVEIVLDGEVLSDVAE